QQQALDALQSATENASLAVASLAAAVTWAGSCNLLIVDPPAYAICEVPAIAAVAAAQYAVSYYNAQAANAAAAYNAITAAIETLEGLLAHCQGGDADGDIDGVQSDVGTGNGLFAQAESVEIPNVESGPLDEANVAVAAAEAAVEEAGGTAVV